MKQKQDLLLSILRPQVKFRIHQSPTNNPKNSQSISNISLRIKTQQSTSPKRNHTKLSIKLLPTVTPITLQYENKNVQIHITLLTTTSDLLATAQIHFPKLTQLVTLNSDFVIDYYLTLPNRPLGPIRDRIFILTAFVGQQRKSESQRNLDNYVLIKCIGTGGFSKVYLAKDKENGRFYAIKLIEKSTIIDKNIQNIVENERNILAVTNHTFINKMHYAFETTFFLVFVNEFCPGGDLLYLLNKNVKFTEQQAKFYCVEFILGLLYLHQLDIIYRDIKPENILIDIDGHIQIADFGLAKPDSHHKTYSFCGSPEYMAPEMLKNEGHTQQLDHYCIGVLLYEMVVGLPPFYSKDIKQIYDGVLHKPIQFPKDSDLSNEVKDLILKLLQKNITTRLGHRGGLLEILDHAWFANVDIIGILQRKEKAPFQPDYCRLPSLVKNIKNSNYEMIRKLLDKSNEVKLVFDNFYYDRNREIDLKLEQEKFYRYYLQMVQQQQGKINRKRKLKK